MGSISNCCCETCASSPCPNHYRRVRLTFGGDNPQVIEAQMHGAFTFLDYTTSNLVELTVTGTPVAGDTFQRLSGATWQDWFTLTAADITYGYRKRVLSELHAVDSSGEQGKFSDNGTVFTGRTTFHPGRDVRVVQQSGSTLVASVVHTSSSYTYSRTRTEVYIPRIAQTTPYSFTMRFDYGDLTITTPAIADMTLASREAGMTVLIADIIDQLQSQRLVDSSLTLTQDGDFLIVERPSLDILFGIYSNLFAGVPGIFPATVFGRNDFSSGTSTNTQMLKLRSEFGAQVYGDCCSTTKTAAIVTTPENTNVSPQFFSSEWVRSVEHTDTFTDGNIYSDIFGCPQSGQTFGDPCTLSPPVDAKTFYSHRIQRRIFSFTARVCLIDGEYELTLSVNTSWRLSRKLISQGAGYNTTTVPDYGVSETGVTHETLSDSISRVMRIATSCPQGDLVFEHAGSTPAFVETVVSLGGRDGDCCGHLEFVPNEKAYQTNSTAPITFEFLE